MRYLAMTRGIGGNARILAFVPRLANVKVTAIGSNSVETVIGLYPAFIVKELILGKHAHFRIASTNSHITGSFRMKMARLIL